MPLQTYIVMYVHRKGETMALLAPEAMKKKRYVVCTYAHRYAILVPVCEGHASTISIRRSLATKLSLSLKLWTVWGISSYDTTTLTSQFSIMAKMLMSYDWDVRHQRCRPGMFGSIHSSRDPFLNFRHDTSSMYAMAFSTICASFNFDYHFLLSGRFRVGMLLWH
jgi:hypothetical protein